MKSLLLELLALVRLPPTLFSDNLGATYLSSNPIFHSRMKYLTIDYHFVSDLVQSSELHDGCDAPNPGCPLTTRQPTEKLYILYHETHT